MELKEVTEINDGSVTHLRIPAATIEDANTIAREWCEENNSLLKNIEQNEGIFIAEITSDDYN